MPILYLAPWVDIGGSDKGTIDWFRHLDRDAYAPSLITTQPSPNRRLHEVSPFAQEIWDLPRLMPGSEFPRFITGFVHTRGIELVHIMHSRLAFELLPDLARLPAPPRIVVQQHVDPPGDGGYVRYVITRYGNLVDAYSVSGEVVCRRLAELGCPPGKRRLIRTGVDAEREFCPERVAPRPEVDRSRFNVLYPARLTAQKDPVLMVDVATVLKAQKADVCIQAVGGGDLEGQVRELIVDRGLEAWLWLHGEFVDIRSWYASCDAVLLTSAFEGVPYVAYEAMAMGKPLVAPSLPGLVEVVVDGAGWLVQRRQDPAAYAEALQQLADDPKLRTAIGRFARQLVRERYTVQQMAREHEELYAQLLQRSRRRPRPQPLGPRPHPEPPAAFRSRRPGEHPLVSVVVPCFNQGPYLADCLSSVAAQAYPQVQTILVDDHSDDPDTIGVLDELAERNVVELLRLDENRGPGAARNAGLGCARGRYVLPLDADDLLLPDALKILVDQLSQAGEQIGFIYPSYQYFGNRRDLIVPPSYNPHALLEANFCQTSALFDRGVFDAGFRYDEGPTIGHEDWEFFVSLAERGIYGEPAARPTLLYRKTGFSRSDLVDASDAPSASAIASRHPDLYHPGRRVQLKARWSPAVTVVALDPVLAESSALQEAVVAAARQSCADFEIVVYMDAEPWPTVLGARLRRVPRALVRSRAEALATGIKVARARYVLATYGSISRLLRDPAVIEKLLRLMANQPGMIAINDLPSALLCPALGPGAAPEDLELPADRPLEVLARWFSGHTSARRIDVPSVRGEDHAPLTAPNSGAPASPPRTSLGRPRPGRPKDAHQRASAPPLLPELPAGVGDWLRWPRVWMPPQSAVLCRHRHVETGCFCFTNDRDAPPRHVLDRDLGCVRRLPLPGTLSLVADPEHPGPGRRFVRGHHVNLDIPGLLGFVEQSPLPLLDMLWVGTHTHSGGEVLLAGGDDPLLAQVRALRLVGYVEPFPIAPRKVDAVAALYGLRGLVRGVDLAARRHRYGIGVLPTGRIDGELGALFDEPVGDCVPLRFDRHGLMRADELPLPTRPHLAAGARWTVEPLRWKAAASFRPRARSVARRAVQLAGRLADPGSHSEGPTYVAGYLVRNPEAGTLPLFASNHPVTGDQLLSTDEREGVAWGYGRATLVGHILARAPVTGMLGVAPRAIPWASRWGDRTG